MTKKIQGIFSSLLTPFKKDSLKVDFDSLMDLVSFVSDHGCHGLIPFGTYSEFNSLSIAEKKQMLASIMESSGDMIVIPNIGSDNFVDTLDFAHYAQGIGVKAIIILPPYFYKDVDIQGLTNYYKKIIDTIDIPVYLYNIPKYTGIEISDQLIENLLVTNKVAGIKDVSGDISQIQHFKKKYPELDIIVSDESLFYDSLLLGVNCFSSSLFNGFPEVVKAIGFDFNQPKHGGKVAQNYLNEVNNIIKKYPRISALKYALTLRGISESNVRPPLTSLSKENEKDLKNSIISYITNPILVV